MVSYQEGSIVSRQVTKSEAGNTTLFAFDTDQALSEHTAPYAALAHVLEGSADISISGQHFTLEAGQAIIMPANAPHAVRASQPFKMLLTMIRA